MRTTGLVFVVLILSGEAVTTANAVKASKIAQAVSADARLVEQAGEDCSQCAPGAGCPACGEGLCCRQMHTDGGVCPGGLFGGDQRYTCVAEYVEPATLAEALDAAVETYREKCVATDRSDAECWSLMRKVLSGLHGALDDSVDEGPSLDAVREKAVDVLIPPSTRSSLCAGAERCDLLGAMRAKLGLPSPDAQISDLVKTLPEELPEPLKNALSKFGTAKEALHALDDDDSYESQQIAHLLEQGSSFVETGAVHGIAPGVLESIGVIFVMLGLNVYMGLSSQEANERDSARTKLARVICKEKYATCYGRVCTDCTVERDNEVWLEMEKKYAPNAYVPAKEVSLTRNGKASKCLYGVDVFNPGIYAPCDLGLFFATRTVGMVQELLLAKAAAPEGSVAEQAGLRPGDVVLEIMGKQMRTIPMLRKFLRSTEFKSAKTVHLKIHRKDVPYVPSHFEGEHLYAKGPAALVETETVQDALVEPEPRPQRLVRRS